MNASECRSTLYGLAVLPSLTILATRGTLPKSAGFWCADAVALVLAWMLARRVLRSLRTLHHQAHSDALTGLLNRRAFTQDLARECARSDRTSAPLTLVYLDVDRFKRVNDQEGHDAGDAVLRRTASMISACLRRAIDKSGRIGGDEFALLLPSTTAAEAAALLARIERRCRQQEARFADGRIGLSAGIAERRPHETPEQLLLRADQAMYARKFGKGVADAGLQALLPQHLLHDVCSSSSQP
jgi:diguanylate cyclase (GGDEF)-like protein